MNTIEAVERYDCLKTVASVMAVMLGLSIITGIVCDAYKETHKTCVEAKP